MPAAVMPSSHGEWFAEFAKSMCILHHEAQPQSVQPFLLQVMLKKLWRRQGGALGQHSHERQHTCSTAGCWIT